MLSDVGQEGSAANDCDTSPAADPLRQSRLMALRLDLHNVPDGLPADEGDDGSRLLSIDGQGVLAAAGHFARAALTRFEPSAQGPACRAPPTHRAPVPRGERPGRRKRGTRFLDRLEG
jgi:hypothetical protein